MTLTMKSISTFCLLLLSGANAVLMRQKSTSLQGLAQTAKPTNLAQTHQYFNAHEEPVELSHSFKHARIKLKRQSYKKPIGTSSSLVQVQQHTQDQCNYDDNDSKELCISLINSNDMSYMGQIYVGTPP